MSRTYKSRVPSVLAAIVVAVAALATYVAAQQPKGVAIRTVRKPVGNARFALDPSRIPRVLPNNIRLPGVCAAPVDVNILTPKIGLNMRTEEKAIWYSLVDTIPPVGHTASITTNPVRLLDGDRKVGTLLSGEVKFREIVQDIPLTGSEPENIAKVRMLLEDFGQLTDKKLAALAPIPVQEYVVPGPGVQVMRARLEETYEIDGIGRDTVQLQGWIAVRHGQARPTDGATEVTWETAVLDTEFVGMDLRGESDLFGPVQVKLDTTRPSFGQVGRIQIPELARVALLAKYKKDAVASNGTVTDTPVSTKSAPGSNRQ
jgi:hypothetical protein